MGNGLICWSEHTRWWRLASTGSTPSKPLLCSLPRITCIAVATRPPYWSSSQASGLSTSNSSWQLAIRNLTLTVVLQSILYEEIIVMFLHFLHLEKYKSIHKK